MKNVTIIKKILYSCLIMFAIMIICAYVAFLNGSTYFLLNNNINKYSLLADSIISCLLFSINLFLIIGICINIKYKSILIATICYIPSWVISFIIDLNPTIYCFILPIMYILFLGLYHHYNMKKLIIKSLFKISIILLYQFITLSYKLNISVFYNVSNIAIIDKVLLQIDLISIMIIIFMIRGDEYDIRTLCSRIQYFFISRQIITQGNDSIGKNENDKDVEKFNNLSNFNKTLVIIMYFAIQILQLFIVACVCIIGKVWVEAIVIFISFFIFRLILKKSWHSKSLTICTLTSTLVFYGTSKMTIPLAKSLFAPILIGLCVAIAMYKIAIHNENVTELLINNKSMQIDIEFLQNELKGKSQLTVKEKEIFRLLKQGYAQVDIGEMLEPPITERTVRRYKKKIEEKLNIKI